MNFIPYSKPILDEDEIQEVVETLRSGWLTTGPKVAQFEADFRSFVGSNYALAVNSATSGLHLALESIGVGPGDKVITTVHTFTATAEVIRYLGAEPLFVDVEGNTFNIDPDAVEQLLETHDVKAIIPVHFAGQAANMSRLLELANKFDVKIVEDAAHALPSTHNGEIVGTLGDITVYSFYANKTITTGEAGMVVTNNKEIADRIKIMRLHGINRDVFDRFTSKKPNWYYEVVAPGFKYNMMDMCAALGIHQLKKANKLREQRESIAQRYNQAFNNLPVVVPQIANPDDIHSWHIYALQLDLDRISISRNEFIELLSDKGIGTSVHYIPLHRMPYWKKRFCLEDDMFPISSKIADRVVSLPNYASMTEEDVTYVIESVRSIIEEHLLT